MSPFLLISVWEAAIGKPANLARLLRSDFPLSAELRIEIALLVEGKLKPKKRGRGRPDSARDPSTAVCEQVFDKTYQAIENYRRVAEWLRKRKSLYGNADKLAISIARKWGLAEEAFLTDLRRAQKSPKMRPRSDHETARFEEWFAQQKKPPKVRK